MADSPEVSDDLEPDDRSDAEKGYRSQRDQRLSRRGEVAAAHAAVVADPDAAEALAAGALGSDDPAVEGEAAAVIGQAAASRDRKRHRPSES